MSSPGPDVDEQLAGRLRFGTVLAIVDALRISPFSQSPVPIFPIVDESRNAEPAHRCRQSEQRTWPACCYDNQFPEVARIVALKGADVILMPHAAREGRWDDTPESQAAARRKVFDFFSSSYRMRARENACFCVYVDQAGRAGYVDSLPRDHFNQPHHPGGAPRRSKSATR